MSTYHDEQYFIWLYNKIGVAKLKNPARTHWHLARQLYQKEFIWFIPNDDNRAEDGKYLRYEFTQVEHIEDPDPDWMSLGCSMLEMLIALSARLNFMTDVDLREWFWELLENIGIGMARTNDQHYNNKIREQVDEILDTVIWRTYDPDGERGLFPLVDPEFDQTKVEIWYQMSAYLLPDVA